MRSVRVDDLELTGVASAGGSATQADRALGLLEVLRRLIPLDAAFLPFTDPAGGRYRGLDPLQSLLAGSRLVRGVTGGTVLRADGGCQVLPGLAADPLLLAGSPLVAAARRRARDRGVCASFLWPVGGAHAPDGHVRVTVLSTPDDVGAGPWGLVLLSPAPHLRGLTPRELEILGLLVEGGTNPDIARRLVITPRTVATHLEHILVKLGAQTRTHAAVRAERDGLYVPAPRPRAPGPSPRPAASPSRASELTPGYGEAGRSPVRPHRTLDRR